MKLSLGLLFFSVISAQAQFQRINVNFYSEFYQGTRAEGAGVVGNQTDIWNGINADNKRGGPVHLADSAGNATAVTLSYSSNGAVIALSGNIQPNEKLMSSYLFSKPNGREVTVTLEKLEPGQVYALYLYAASNDAGDSDRAATLTVNGAKLAASGDPKTQFMLGSNYVYLKVPADADGRIMIVETPAPTNTTHEIDLNGLQLVAPQYAGRSSTLPRVARR